MLGMKEAKAGGSLNWILIWSTSKFKGSQSYKVRYCPLKKMLLHLKLYFVYTCVDIFVGTLMWRPEGHLQKSALSFYHMSCGNWTGVPRLSDNCLYPLSHQNIGPFNFFYLKISLISSISSNWGFKVFQAVQATCFLYAALTVLEFAL